jgi:hypothetical protein
MKPDLRNAARLAELQAKSKQVIKDVKAGLISKTEAANLILEIRDEMEEIMSSVKQELKSDLSQIKKA